MTGLRTASLATRAALTALLVLLLGLRALGSVGFMPTVEHGRLALIVCPGGEWAEAAAAMPRMDHHSPAHQHQTCPYAEAGAIPFAAGPAPIVPMPLLAFLLLGVFALASFAAGSQLERPRQTGPPILA